MRSFYIPLSKNPGNVLEEFRPIFESDQIEKTGIERIAEEGTDVVPSDTPVPLDVEDAFTAEPSIGARADLGARHKTLMPKIAGGFKLPPSSLLHRADDQHAVNEEEQLIHGA